MITETSYTRGQVTLALWKAFTWNTSAPSAKPTSIFRARIKRLLELDRKKEPSKGNGPHAFTADIYPGTGSNMAYSDFDAFYLGLSLNMLDAGMKPADILWLLRHEKPSFENVYDSIMMTPRAAFRSHLAKSTPDSLSREENGSHNSDIRVFALLRKIKLREVFPLLSNQSEDHPIFYVPVYCRGIEKLDVSLKDMGIDYRHVQIFELAHLAWDVKESLAKAPEVRRGRP